MLYRLFRSFYDALTIYGLILRNKRGDRLKYMITFSRVLAKHAMSRLFGMRIRQERIFDYKVSFLSYSQFFSLFTSIFIAESCAFHAKKRNPKIIDCGANIGVLIMYYKMAYPSAKILAFEPDPKIFGLLKKNVESNKLKDVSLVNSAVYSEDGKIDFYINKNTGLSSSIYSSSQTTEKISVPCVKLSRYLKEPVDFVKIDIEGAECEVLQEIGKALANVGEILIEYHYGPSNKKNDILSILKILENAKFKYVLSDLDGREIRAPYYHYKNTPYYLVIYGYRAKNF